jgi:hypothetical protein
MLQAKILLSNQGPNKGQLESLQWYILQKKILIHKCNKQYTNKQFAEIRLVHKNISTCIHYNITVLLYNIKYRICSTFLNTFFFIETNNTKLNPGLEILICKTLLEY